MRVIGAAVVANPSAREVWRKLVAEAGEDEIELAASLPIEDVERELAAYGFDVAAERAKGEAFLAELAGEPEASGQRPVTAAHAVENVRAADLRRKAAASCDVKQWAECLEWLAEAKKVDPAGDEAPEARGLRERAIRGLGEKPEGKDKPK
jgi:hypothetical protein